MKIKIFIVYFFLIFTTQLFGNDIRFSFGIGEISVGGEANTEEQKKNVSQL